MRACWPADESSAVVDISVGDMLREAVAAAPGATALVAGTAGAGERRRWTYTELLEQSELAAAGRSPDPDVLFAYCRERLAPHKAPRHWRVVDAFPLTPSGKIKKYVLRDELIADLGVGELANGPDISSAAPPA